MPAAPVNPSTEEMLITEPPPAAVIGAMTFLTPSHSPIRFTSITSRNSASVMSAMFLFRRMPALLTRTLRLAERRGCRCDRGSPLRIRW